MAEVLSARMKMSLSFYCHALTGLVPHSSPRCAEWFGSVNDTRMVQEDRIGSALSSLDLSLSGLGSFCYSSLWVRSSACPRVKNHARAMAGRRAWWHFRISPHCNRRPLHLRLFFHFAFAALISRQVRFCACVREESARSRTAG